MSEPNAAMGVTSLEAMAGFAEINKRNYHAYREGLEGVRGVRVMAQDETEAANYQYVVITVDPDLAGADRETVYATLTAENVLVRRYFFPNCHQIVPYRDRPDVHMPLPLPRAETLTEQVIALPTGTAIGPAEVAGVCAIIRRAVGR
jgi:dTDP-4-amino-4,6-dideoxyglucose